MELISAILGAMRLVRNDENSSIVLLGHVLDQGECMIINKDMAEELEKVIPMLKLTITEIPKDIDFLRTKICIT